MQQNQGGQVNRTGAEVKTGRKFDHGWTPINTVETCSNTWLFKVSFR